jgi:sulfur-oxidizing protein SoxX
MNKILTLAALAATGAALMGCSSMPSQAELDQMAMKVIQTSFRDQGIAKVDRLQQDLAQAACSSEKAPNEATQAKIMEEAKRTVKFPADGNFMGDWQQGERIAQSGRGMTWTDTSTAPSANGGNCYNCHQISKEEISYGTIGPSLYQYGKNRGITGTDSPTYKPIAEYTWMKLYNARTYSACSQMPRFGHAALLDETQMRHIMALLLDPKSPVNR